MTFGECVLFCGQQRGLVAQFDRLRGDTNALEVFGHKRRAPLDQMVDESSGRDRYTLKQWTAFVWECVWTRLPPECFATAPEETP